MIFKINLKITTIFFIVLLFLGNFAFLISADKNKNNTIKSLYYLKKNTENDFIDLLEPGDIILYLPGNEKHYGHTRFFTGYNQSTGKYTIIESYYHVVRYSLSKSALRFVLISLASYGGYSGIDIIRVNASPEQKQNAIDFVELHIGDKFQFNIFSDKNFNPEDTSDRLAGRWYCSELPWAAYYNCNNSFPKEKPEGRYIYGEGIDIDYNGWELDGKINVVDKYLFVPPKDFAFVSPTDFLLDNDVERIPIWINPNKDPYEI